jgi:hypothetical protein
VSTLYEIHIRTSQGASSLATAHAPPPVERSLIWTGLAETEEAALESAWTLWDQRYGATTRPFRPHIRATAVG